MTQHSTSRSHPVDPDPSPGRALAPAAPRHMPPTAAWWDHLQAVAAAADGVGEYTRLLPVAALNAILAEAETPRSPASRDHAADLTALIVGSYPSHRHVGDPAIYARALASLFTEHAPDVGREAVEAITRSSRFLPSRAEVHAALEAIEVRRRAAVAVARRMLREHERREKLRRIEEERERDGPLDLQEILAGLVRSTRAGGQQGRGDAR